jgi:hypothetical protein
MVASRKLHNLPRWGMIDIHDLMSIVVIIENLNIR